MPSRLTTACPLPNDTIPSGPVAVVPFGCAANGSSVEPPEVQRSMRPFRSIASAPPCQGNSGPERPLHPSATHKVPRVEATWFAVPKRRQVRPSEEYHIPSHEPPGTVRSSHVPSWFAAVAMKPSETPRPLPNPPVGSDDPSLQSG